MNQVSESAGVGPKPASPAAPAAQRELQAAWATLCRNHKSRPLEWLVEKGIFLTSLSAIVMVFLIFAFVANKAWPIFAGKTNSSKVFQPIPVADMAKHSPAELQQYLGVSAAQWEKFDDETRRTLMEVKLEEAKERPDDKDAAIASHVVGASGLRAQVRSFDHEFRRA